MPHELTTRIPFAFARSALFRPAERRGDVFNLTEIPSASDYAITLHYTGPELSPCHATAWQALVALAFERNKCVERPLDVKLIDILRAMGRTSIQTHAKRWLGTLLAELTSAHVHVSSPRQQFHGLLLSTAESMSNGVVRVTFPQGMAQLLSNEVVHMPVASKAGLTAYPLACWLHDYLSTHHQVYEIPLTTLHTLCGSALVPATFRRRVCDALEAVSAHSSVLTRYSVQKGILTLHKKRTRVVLLAQEHRDAHVPAWKEKADQQARNQRIRGFL
jgi:hypothetical protein